MKPIKLTAFLKSFGEAGWIAWIEGSKGMAVQGASAEKAWKELLISLRVKIAYDFGIDINQIGEKEFLCEEDLNESLKQQLESGQKEINLTLA